jgi:hypothetical protein
MWAWLAARLTQSPERIVLITCPECQREWSLTYIAEQTPSPVLHLTTLPCAHELALTLTHAPKHLGLKVQRHEP